MQRKQFLFLLPLLAAVAATRVFGSMILPIYDDAFITFRYGKHLAELGSFVYNGGEWVLGTTAPAFGLLSALFYILHLPMPATVLVLNISVDVILAYLIYKIVSTEFSQQAGILSVLFFAVSPILIRISVGGMEANLFMLLVLTALLCYRRGQITTAIVIASLSYFFRPEGALLALFLIGNEVVKKQFVSAIKLGLISLVTVAPGLILIYLSYGSFFSHSVIAKSGQHQEIVEVFKRLVIPEPASIAFLVVLLVGIRYMIRAQGLLRNFFAFVGLYLAAYLIMRPWVWSWYAMPVQVALVVGAGVSIAGFLSRFKTFDKPVFWQRYAAITGMVCVIGVWGMLYKIKGSSGVTEHIYGSLPASIPSLHDRSLLATDIGAIGYFSDAKIYDGLGLVTPDALAHISVDDMIRVKEPDALFLNTSSATRSMMQSDYFAEHYTFARRYGPSGDTTLPADTSAYIEGWQQDYLLYLKRPQ